MQYETDCAIYFDFQNLGLRDLVPFSYEELTAAYTLATTIIDRYSESSAETIANMMHYDLRLESKQNTAVDEEWVFRAATANCILGLLGTEIPPHRFSLD